MKYSDWKNKFLGPIVKKIEMGSKLFHFAENDENDENFDLIFTNENGELSQATVIKKDVESILFRLEQSDENFIYFFEGLEASEISEFEAIINSFCEHGHYSDSDSDYVNFYRKSQRFYIREDLPGLCKFYYDR